MYIQMHGPSIAQLVERWTVVTRSLSSIGRWFKSGSKEVLFIYFFIVLAIIVGVMGSKCISKCMNLSIAQLVERWTVVT